MWKKIRRFVDLEFVKTCQENVIIFNSFSISMQFIFNLFSIYFLFLCNSLVTDKMCTLNVNFDGTLKKANRVCSLTLFLCCAILVLLSFNSVHTDCCTMKAFSTKYQKRKRKREIQLFFYGNYLGILKKRNFFSFQF